jgi:DNA-binding Xre family transcriptional regulator
MNIVIRIREVAISKGVMTAYRLQKLAKLSPSNAAKLYSNDIVQVSMETLGKLCEALDCDACELFVRPKPASRPKANTNSKKTIQRTKPRRNYP